MTSAGRRDRGRTERFRLPERGGHISRYWSLHHVLSAQGRSRYTVCRRAEHSGPADGTGHTESVNKSYQAVWRPKCDRFALLHLTMRRDITAECILKYIVRQDGGKFISGWSQDRQGLPSDVCSSPSMNCFIKRIYKLQRFSDKRQAGNKMERVVSVTQWNYIVKCKYIKDVNWIISPPEKKIKKNDISLCVHRLPKCKQKLGNGQLCPAFS